MKSLSLMMVVVLFCFSVSALGYEVETHQWMTRVSFDRSILGRDGSPFLDIGLRSKDDLFPDSHGRLQSVSLLAEIGAVYEDDGDRALNHFFDPQNGGRPLTFVAAMGEASPTWVLEDTGEIRAQSFSLKDALDFYHSGLTLAKLTQRNYEFGRLFETIGRAIHHLQDMSQPQHVRNDQHLKGFFTSAYEKYTLEKTRRMTLNSGDYGTAGAVDLHEFNTARKFWENAGKGVAEFTSRNFVSNGTNFERSNTRAGSLVLTDENYPAPAAQPCASQPLLRRVQTSELPGVTMQGFVDFVATPVIDVATGDVTCNPRTSTLSIFSPDLDSAGWSTEFTLNRFNYDAAHAYLIPRAIAYSAGLINYFFRGRLEVDSFEVSGYLATVVVRNVSAAEFKLADSLETSRTQEFEVWYTSTDGTRKRASVLNGNLSDAVVAYGATWEIQFTIPADVNTAERHPYMLVFKGCIGTEEGVIGQVMRPMPPEFLVTPNYIPSDGIAGPRVIRWTGTQWVLTQDTDYEAGAVDWKGFRKSDVLTWGVGSSRRYHGPGGGPVFKDGHPLTRGPAMPYGAAIYGASIRYVDNVRTLNIAVITGDGTLKIYSRKFASRYTNEDMWSPLNVYGWREVYSGQHGTPYTHFFFNSSGTEGQYLTLNTTNFMGPKERIKIRLSGDSGVATTFPALATVKRTVGDVSTTSPTIDIQYGYCFVGPSSSEIRPDSTDSCRRVGFTSNQTTTIHAVDVWTFSNKTIFCVDYKGDTEVFCELLPHEGGDTTDQTISADTDYLNLVGPAECGVLKNATTYRDSWMNESKTLRGIRIGDVEIPWKGNTSHRSYLHSYAGDSYVSPGGTWNGSYAWEGEMLSISSALIFADARYSMVMYQADTITSKGAGNGAYDFTKLYYQIPSHTENTYDTRIVLKLGSTETTVIERNSSSTSDPVYEKMIGTPGGLAPGCEQQPSSSDTRVTSEGPDSGVITTFYSDMDRNTWIATNQEMHLGASQYVSLPSMQDYPKYFGVWNYLSNGSLPELIPGQAPSDGYHYEVRVIR